MQENTETVLRDEPTDEEIVEAIAIADELSGDIIDIDDNQHPGGVAYFVWAELTHQLSQNGWTETELIQDLVRIVTNGCGISTEGLDTVQ
jgi:hypothetical protein